MDIHINKKITGVVIILVAFLVVIGIGFMLGIHGGESDHKEKMGFWSKDSYNDDEQNDNMGINPNRDKTASTTTATATHSTMAGIGAHCGGNMTTAATCNAGLHCAPTPGSHLPFGDVGGTCIAN